MVRVDQRIVEIIIFQAKFNRRESEFFAFVAAVAFRHRAGAAVADNDFQRNDRKFFDALFTVIQAFDEMRRHAVFRQKIKEECRNFII